MILSKYIAIQTNLETSKITDIDLTNLEQLLLTIFEKDILNVEEARDIIGRKSELMTSISSLLERAGIIKNVTQKEVEMQFLRLTNFGRFIFEMKYNKQSFAQTVTPFLLTWLPLKLFLKHIGENPSTTLDKIKTDLGYQMARHTSDISTVINSELIFPESMKPFEEKTIKNVLLKITDYLSLVTYPKITGPYRLTPLGKYFVKSLDFLNYQFQNIDPNITPTHLALIDFIERGVRKMVVYSDLDNITEMKAFHKLYVEKIGVDTNTNPIYKTRRFNAMISPCSAFWEYLNIYNNISYDQVKVLEINAKIMNSD